MFVSRIRTQHIVVHCTATKPQRDITLADVTEWHVSRGWRDVGYHALIRRNGKIEFGRQFDTVGAHVAGHNTSAIGFALVGGLYRDGSPAVDDFEGLYTIAQDTSLEILLRMVERAYPAAEIVGHRDLSPDSDGDGKVEQHEWLKTCPGFDVRAYCARKGI